MTATNLDWAPLPIAAGQLYESARWLPDPGVFQWVDILGSTLHRWRPGEAEVETRPLDLEFTTMALPLDADRSLVTSRSSLHEYDWSRGSLRTLGTWEFAPDVRFNDGGVAPDGTAYLGTMSMDRNPTSGTLFRWTGDDLVPVVRGVGISNGIGWAATGRGFYIDSLVPRVNLLDLTSDQPVTQWVDLGMDDEPDGLVVTPEGDVLVALWEGQRLAHLAADGRRLPDLAVPSHSPTSVAVGGPDASLLLVTTAGVGGSPSTAAYDGLVLVAQRQELTQ